jgi:lipopolysaccharide assembly outer membrane protein LptD (OstA)
MHAAVNPDTTARQDTVTLAARDTSGGRRDTTKAAKSPSGIDTTVVYSATDSVIYDISKKMMYLYGNGDIKHKELRLKAENININWTTSVLNAAGVRDTADTTGKKYRGLPDLVDGSETYHGYTIAYNFKTKKGKIDVGKTEIEKSLYYGEEIKKVEADVLFVEDGKFTSCDKEHPHYYFASPTMKVIVKDKIIARPVYMYIADVPVFALPFGIFPSERGRRSGLIAPAYGSSDRGRYLTHLGYYWAISDYMDWNMRTDLYSKGSYTLYSDYRYALRYNFTGDLSASFARSVTGEVGDPGYSDTKVYNLHVGHSQSFNPTTNLRVDFTFTSGSYYQRTSNNLNDLLQQDVVSNATLTKSWEGTPNSMTLNISRDQNLQPAPNAVESRTVLPSFSFNHGQSFPFRSAKHSGSGNLALWELIGYTYSGQFQNVITRMNDSTFSRDDNHGVLQNFSLNLSPRAGYFSITPFFNFTEKWYDRRTRQRFNQTDSTVVTDVQKGFRAIHTYQVGVSASTKLFGILQPGILGITGIRHQLVPSISYTYQPDFSKPQYGYFGRYNDQNGVEHVYSYYDGSLYGGAPAGEVQAISMNIGNVFEMKRLVNDTTGKEDKFQLLNLGLGLSYNLAADSIRFSELSVNFRTAIGQVLSISGNASYNLYKFVVDPLTSAGRRVNTLLLSDQGRLGDLTNFGISVGTRLSGEKKKPAPGTAQADTLARTPKTGFIGLYDQEEPDFSIPWNMDLTWNFYQSQADPRFKFRSSTLSAALGFNLTDAWKISASASYDIVNKVFAAPQITIYRDLHCWEMNFYWVPAGQYRNFRLEIKLKAPQLQDIKVTKQVNARGIY